MPGPDARPAQKVRHEQHRELVSFVAYDVRQGRFGQLEADRIAADGGRGAEEGGQRQQDQGSGLARPANSVLEDPHPRGPKSVADRLLMPPRKSVSYF